MPIDTPPTPDSGLYGQSMSKSERHTDTPSADPAQPLKARIGTPNGYVGLKPHIPPNPSLSQPQRRVQSEVDTFSNTGSLRGFPYRLSAMYQNGEISPISLARKESRWKRPFSFTIKGSPSNHPQPRDLGSTRNDLPQK